MVTIIMVSFHGRHVTPGYPVRYGHQRKAVSPVAIRITVCRVSFIRVYFFLLIKMWTRVHSRKTS